MDNSNVKSSLYLANLPKCTIIYPVDERIVNLLIENLGHQCLLEKIEEGIGNGDIAIYKAKLNLLCKELFCFELADAEVKSIAEKIKKNVSKIKDNDPCFLHSMIVTAVIVPFRV
eukprot:TRINITY_DN2279_c0_g4_i2.p1 TRINITY_DN2279_c0_g4~~TRINITY_DN2279_c0_g4_i2.p1  ORF type:complete len:115 (-),score=18.49 TRINITY_DN2279_c0_g4_i2:555-899(-)